MAAAKIHSEEASVSSGHKTNRQADKAGWLADLQGRQADKAVGPIDIIIKK